MCQAMSWGNVTKETDYVEKQERAQGTVATKTEPGEKALWKPEVMVSSLEEHQTLLASPGKTSTL